ncbi:MAG: hypothetical protein LBC80_10275 [Treponema sp.]|jgi:hypothetical protein|nr:hypothetical protein [Treponema sp.]
MLTKKSFFSFLFLLFVIQFVFSFGSGEKANIVQVTGVVRLVGSSPLPELVVSGSEHEWYVIREEINKLHHLQHRTVTVEGEETVTELFFVNGMSAGIRRELRNIRIINIH